MLEAVTAVPSVPVNLKDRGSVIGCGRLTEYKFQYSLPWYAIVVQVDEPAAWTCIEEMADTAGLTSEKPIHHALDPPFTWTLMLLAPPFGTVAGAAVEALDAVVGATCAVVGAAGAEVGAACAEVGATGAVVGATCAEVGATCAEVGAAGAEVGAAGAVVGLTGVVVAGLADAHWQFQSV
jgi:hypothetical protein